MNTRIYNVRILTMEEGGKIAEGEVWIEDDTIICVGQPKETAKRKWDLEIDGKQNLLMP